MHVLARQTIRRGNQHAFKFGLSRAIPQAIQARAIQGCAAVAIIAKDIFVRELPRLRLNMGAQAFQLLLNGLRLRLALR
jgi:hypothetical protein